MVDLDKSIDMADVQANCRVALRNDSYKLHKILPNKVRDPLKLSVVVVPKADSLFDVIAIFL